MPARLCTTSPSIHEIVSRYEAIMSPAEKERLSDILWKYGEAIADAARAMPPNVPVAKAHLYSQAKELRQEGLRLMPPLPARYYRR